MVLPDRNLIRNRPGLGRRSTLVGRRAFDLAEGILIGFRGCSPDAAFNELVTAAHRYDVSISAIASALVDLATGATDPAETHPAARAAALAEWGHLVAAPAIQP